MDIVTMPENRLPSKVYKMLYTLHSKNKNNSTTENKNNAAPHTVPIRVWICLGKKKVCVM